jgi:hypothetical protein
MSEPVPIQAPAGYAPAYAIGFADSAENLVLVSEDDPLPVASSAPAPTPLVGQSSGGSVAGPFTAVPGRVVTLTLGGTWQGLVKLLRSTDGGSTLVPLRVAGEPWAEYTVSGCEQAWLETEEGASFYLDIELASGVVEYRVSQ